jgi:hypothetical protein
LAKIGALALSFNELESILDQLFFVIIGVDEYLQFEVSTRINGIEGKIGIVKHGLSLLLQEEDANLIAETLGEGGFMLCKKYRDGAIHVRHLNADTGIGTQVKNQGNVFSLLVREDILDAAYDFNVAIARELSAFVYLLGANKKINSLDPVDPKKAQLEEVVEVYRVRFLDDRKNRLSLPPFPKFPSESELREAEHRHQQAQLAAIVAAMQPWGLPPHFQSKQMSPALWNTLSLQEPPLPLVEAERKK